MSGDYELTDDEKALVKKIGKEAHDMQRKYRGCSQTTLLALQENLGTGNNCCVRAATTLCSGVAGRGVGPCGALLGAMMAVGIEFGRSSVEEKGAPREGGPSNFSRAFKMGGEIYLKFKKHFKGQINCWDIQEVFYEKEKLHPELPGGKYYNSLAFEMQPYKDSGVYFDCVSEKACEVVQVAAEMGAEIILRERKVDAEQGKHVF